MQTIRQQLVGNCFLKPTVDYLLIGSLWSIVLTAYWLVRPSSSVTLDSTMLVWFVLLANSAHFAASTVRLYSKPAYYKEFSFLIFTFPLVTAAVLIAAILLPGVAGKYLQALYLTWAPFHYAKQIYGLSLMYTFRSGIKPGDAEKRLIYWTSMMPFLYAFMSGSRHYGLGWLLPPEILITIPGLAAGLTMIKTLLAILVFVVPVFLYWQIWKSKRQVLPLMVLAMMVSNGLWWTALNYYDAFVVATVAHGVQYMAIMLIYHVREQLREPDNKHGWVFHTAIFYGKCVLLGYALFNCWPFIFVWMGAGFAESMLMVIAIINLHHFIVDAYIWRLRVPVNRKALVDVPAMPKAA